jgi:hypothetical protein
MLHIGKGIQFQLTLPLVRYKTADPAEAWSSAQHLLLRHHLLSSHHQ